ncbi:MAG: tRNA preQ1(34) S-adenosylmethionine ribosyltransferase-isomerase QueA [Spirochaetota bacterium]
MEKTRDYYFDLPEELIAQYPSDRRGESRMLVLDRETGNLEHSAVHELHHFIPPDSTVVVNNSKVRKARVFGQTEFGGVVEFLFLEALDNRYTWKVIVSKAKRQKVGRTYTFSDAVFGKIISGEHQEKVLQTNVELSEDFFDQHGHIPLPPYIHREDEFTDENRYQTIYAQKHGSVAAPTAGLHFTHDIIDRLTAKGVDIVPITLHVGPGTFLPIRTEDIAEHTMHSEQYEISEDAANRLNQSLREGKPITAVGTTSVRTLESAYDSESGVIEPGIRATQLFITPGYQFNVVDHLLTNFHTPQSTLLILVSAFAGRETVLSAYREAVNRKYRFFSYGDAMLIR